jgi:hypothetical protein
MGLDTKTYLLTDWPTVSRIVTLTLSKTNDLWVSELEDRCGSVLVSWGWQQCGNTEEKERPPLEAATEQR